MSPPLTVQAEGGMARLYRGIVLYNIKVAPSAAVQFATFHGLKRLVESADARRFGL